MATADVSIVDSAWTLVANASTKIYMTAKGPFPVVFQVQSSLPAANSVVGHLIPEDGLSLTLGVGENVYAKSGTGNNIVTVTTFV